MGYVCKMCGKLLPDTEGSGICECEFCGSRQTVPKLYKDKYAEIYNRACGLRFKTDFEGAEKLFSQLCEEFPEEPEGYWERVLCRCGILYEDEPVSGLKVPVCHRAYGVELADDKDCCAALSLSDAEQSAVYRREASALEMLRRDMLERVGTGESYDVYICCRIADEQGNMTADSIIAEEMFRQLSQEGMRVFYAPETLGDMTEKDSETYINAAIRRSSVLIVISAGAESFASPHFKSEWGRCAAAARTNADKLIVVCIKDTDKGEVPAELADNMIMEASEMSFLAELIRTVRRHIGGDDTGFAEHSAAARSAPEKLIRRMNIFLADEDFEAAEEYSDMILDAAPECWQAHYAKFLAFNGCRSGNDLLLEEVVRSFADDYILRYGYDFSDNDLFEKQLKTAVYLDMPVIVHDREAHEDTLRLLKKYKPRGVLHCYSGSVEMLRELEKLDLYIGLGGAVTFKNARKPLEAAAAVPLERLLLETDAPYMAPVPLRGKRCDSTMIPYVAEKIAEARGIGPDAVLAAAADNAKRLFRL